MFKKTMAKLSPRKMRRNPTRTAASTHNIEHSSALESVGSSVVVLSNFPPTFTRRDLEKLFSSFHVAEELTLPDNPCFAYPLRTTVVLKDREEALRAVKALHRISVGGRRVVARMADENEGEKTVALIEYLVDGLKIGIMSKFSHSTTRILNRVHTLKQAYTDTARVYYPHLATMIIEVREHTTKTEFFAFLQAREPVTIHSEPHVQAMTSQNLTEWQLIASANAEEDIGRGIDRNARMLRRTLEEGLIGMREC
jgi:RNA recognition motif-containing protein